MNRLVLAALRGYLRHSPDPSSRAALAGRLDKPGLRLGPLHADRDHTDTTENPLP